MNNDPWRLDGAGWELGWLPLKTVGPEDQEAHRQDRGDPSTPDVLGGTVANVYGVFAFAKTLSNVLDDCSWVSLRRPRCFLGFLYYSVGSHLVCLL